MVDCVNFAVGDCVAGDIHRHTRAKFRGDAMEEERRERNRCKSCKKSLFKKKKKGRKATAFKFDPRFKRQGQWRGLRVSNFGHGG